VYRGIPCGDNAVARFCVSRTARARWEPGVVYTSSIVRRTPGSISSSRRIVNLHRSYSKSESVNPSSIPTTRP
jgi:hypothetical protein